MALYTCTNTSAFVELRVLSKNERVLVALAKAQYNLLKVFHNGDRGTIHQLQSSYVVWLDELMRLAELGEIPAIYSNHNPAVRQTMIVPLKLLHILELTFRHGRQADVSARNHLFAPIDYP